MKNLFICALFGIKIDEDLGEGVDVYYGIKITNNLKKIKKYFDPYFVEAVGGLEVEAIMNAGAVCFATDRILDAPFNPKKELIKFLAHVQGIQFLLWLLRDNSVTCELAFYRYHKADKVFHDSNLIGSLYSTAAGQKRTTKFTKSELEGIAKLGKPLMHSHPEFVQGDTALKKGTHRLHNVFCYHLQSARSTPDIGMKILKYCTAFESLFSSSPAELAHQLSERLAFYLKDTPEERRDIFISMKDAYKIRSIVTHGDLLSPGLQEKMKAVAYTCDSIAREVFLKVMSDEEFLTLVQNRQGIDNYFICKIFGISCNDEVQQAGTAVSAGAPPLAP